MVRPARIELATFGFVDQRSIQLSYGRTFKGLRLILAAQPELIIRKRLCSCKEWFDPLAGCMVSDCSHACPGMGQAHDVR